MVADALKFFGAEVSYFSRHRKADADNAGFVYMPLDELLNKNEIICTCIPRNNYLLGKREFSILGNNKIVVNTSVGPTFDVAAMKDWLNESPDNYYLCDATGMGNVYEELKSCSNLLYTPYISGKSIQSVERLSQKALANIESYLTASANNK